MLRENLTILWIAIRSERPENTPDNQKYSSWTSWIRKTKSGGSPILASPGGSLTLFLYQDGRNNNLTPSPPTHQYKRKISEFTYISYHSLWLCTAKKLKTPHLPSPHKHTCTQRKNITSPTEFYPHIYYQWFGRSITTPTHPPQRMKWNKKFLAKMPLKSEEKKHHKELLTLLMFLMF